MGLFGRLQEWLKGFSIIRWTVLFISTKHEMDDGEERDAYYIHPKSAFLNPNPEQQALVSCNLLPTYLSMMCVRVIDYTMVGSQKNT